MSFESGFEKFPVAAKVATFHAVIEQVIVRPDEIEIVLKNPGFDPFSGGRGGKDSLKTNVLPLVAHDSGRRTVAHSDTWGDRQDLSEIQHLPVRSGEVRA